MIFHHANLFGCISLFSFSRTILLYRPSCLIMNKTSKEGTGMQNHNKVHYKTGQKAEIDIHNMTREQAQRYIELYLNRADGSVKEVTVIHGYTGGTVLRDMVRHGLHHPRIQSVYASLNPGTTILVLK